MSNKKNGKHVLADGTEKWYQDDLIHRETGPAVIGDNGQSLVWFKHGMMHRDDGPAVILMRNEIKSEKWFLNGKETTENEVKERWHAMQEKKQLDNIVKNQDLKNKIKI